ncbi:MAG: hypothetical protein EZS28_010727 [Streblomastix strix]|uniref:Uncharacterized protein n=1 Tax=Streblomastix strix TaxID=222440 RepID=A0A5J4WFU6_9EUKA|nr:MAG: hypothetical protein EZS28_010727 [Streblomastix strix]
MEHKESSHFAMKSDLENLQFAENPLVVIHPDQIKQKTQFDGFTECRERSVVLPVRFTYAESDEDDDGQFKTGGNGQFAMSALCKLALLAQDEEEDDDQFALNYEPDLVPSPIPIPGPPLQGDPITEFVRFLKFRVCLSGEIGDCVQF